MASGKILFLFSHGIPCLDERVDVITSNQSRSFMVYNETLAEHMTGFVTWMLVVP